MSEAQRAATPAYDYRHFIIADADTGRGGDPHVRNLIRRFVEEDADLEAPAHARWSCPLLRKEWSRLSSR